MAVNQLSLNNIVLHPTIKSLSIVFLDKLICSVREIIWGTQALTYLSTHVTPFSDVHLIHGILCLCTRAPKPMSCVCLKPTSLSCACCCNAPVLYASVPNNSWNHTIVQECCCEPNNPPSTRVVTFIAQPNLHTGASDVSLNCEDILPHSKF